MRRSGSIWVSKVPFELVTSKTSTLNDGALTNHIDPNDKSENTEQTPAQAE